MPVAEKDLVATFLQAMPLALKVLGESNNAEHSVNLTTEENDQVKALLTLRPLVQDATFYRFPPNTAIGQKAKSAITKLTTVYSYYERQGTNLLSWLQSLAANKPKTQNLLTSKTRYQELVFTSAKQLKDYQVSALLNLYPLEKLIDALPGITMDSFKYTNFTSVGDLLAHENELEKAEGIGPAKFAVLIDSAERIRNDISLAHTLKIDPDTQSTTENNIISQLLVQAYYLYQLDFMIEQARNATIDPMKAPIVELPSSDIALRFYRVQNADFYATLTSAGVILESEDKRYDFVDPQLIESINNLNLNLAGLQATLRPYQEFGAKYVIHQKRVIIGDEMGLGKTVEALAILTHLTNQYTENIQESTTVIVIPSTEEENPNSTNQENKTVPIPPKIENPLSTISPQKENQIQLISNSQENWWEQAEVVGIIGANPINGEDGFLTYTDSQPNPPTVLFTESNLLPLENLPSFPHFLVICPLAVLVNWERETLTKTALPAYKLRGDDIEDVFNVWLENGGVAIATYESIQKLNIPNTISIQTTIIDEAHYAKNEQTRWNLNSKKAKVEADKLIAEGKEVPKWKDVLRTKYTKAILARSEYALLLTGTPLENKSKEFRTLLRYVAPDLVIDAQDFEPTRFRQQIATAYLRRIRADVLQELPELVEMIDWLEMTETDLRHYTTAVALGKWHDMRRSAIWGGMDSSKIPKLIDIIKDAVANNHKTLIFTYYIDSIAIIKEAIAHELPAVKVYGPITGSPGSPEQKDLLGDIAVTPEERQAVIDDYTADPNPSVLLAQITAGGVGLNIQAASTLIIIEPQVKPSIEMQAISRAFRMGQINKVVVHRLINTEGIDLKMVEMLGVKQELFDNLAHPSEMAHTAIEVLGEEAVGGEIQDAIVEDNALPSVDALPPSDTPTDTKQITLHMQKTIIEDERKRLGIPPKENQ